LNATTLTITRSLNNKNLLNSIIDPQENNWIYISLMNNSLFFGCVSQSPNISLFFTQNTSNLFASDET
jgi:hypothetical protein